MLPYSETDVKNAAELREWILKQISEKQEELERFKNILLIIDNLLKQESFKPATYVKKLQQTRSNNTKSSKLDSNEINQSSDEINSTSNYNKNNSNSSKLNDNIQNESKNIYPEFKELKRFKDNLLLAKVKILSEFLEIYPNKELGLKTNTPPFKSFFIKRILEGMISQDKDLSNQNKLIENKFMRYVIDESNGQINKITIYNYRNKNRLNDIFNTCSWVFARMIEKTSFSTQKNAK
ncbi:MAG: hypothetical protein ACPKQO_10300 [Nitrososphaeraceae archaeon]